ncbi:LacI family DNA-binding transcriptional regulator [Amycolatopsis sp. 195334CR]|uniref:LacI family DNA-binding transcriptional regulator n=1 Tax=Amycolatopsis sp. 195334CR TaxID=2814588 RepID=UPI001A8F78A9|nr:LacI family DNA-binding transcriptional regulator [Amycolatopsis sp. 195334CR]MBN6041976.1 LacI family DNA-binding transcriptional regulator [Amycolatopsis sp. 195334CR]
MATLRDVAVLAGVSVKTVSNVVNGYDFVKPENRRRVEDALAATGYRPNLGARNLRRGRTGFLALVVPELSIPYFGELAGAVLTAARGRGWNVLIEETQGNRENERATLASLGPHMADGAIISPEALEPGDLTDPTVPLVLLGEHTVDLPMDHAGIDNVLAARTAVRHLVEVGRRRIAVIGQHPRRGTAALRLAGYREALAEAGLREAPELIATATRYHQRDGAEAMTHLLDLPEPPDAVFCFNDMLALGAVRAAFERGRSVPGDIAVAGFDNTEQSAYSLPSLTTIAPDKTALARAAVELVHRRTSGTAPAAPEDVRIPFSLEIRESTTG